MQNIIGRLDSSQGFFYTVYEITDQSNDSNSTVQMTLLSAAISRGPAMPTDPAVARPAPEIPGISANLPVYRHPGNMATMVQTMALTPNERGGEECAGDFNPRDFLSES